MWSFWLVFGLLCWGSHGSVTCKNDRDAEVDWYILYKIPKMALTPSTSTTGTEYFYIDSTGSEELNNINSPNGVLGNTLRPLFRPIRNMEETFGFISYSDQPPGCDADSKRFGQSKGLVMVDETSTGVWILHSTPQFPFRREQNNFWPTSGNQNAQTFICVTFNYDQFTKIGTHLKYINAFPFEHYIPNNFHEELKNVVNWAEGSPYSPDKVEVSSLTSKGNQGFQIFAKQANANEDVGDLYLSIANNFMSDVYAQTWRCKPDQSYSHCSSDFKVINVEDLTVGNRRRWKPSKDHSKWPVGNVPAQFVIRTLMETIFKLSVRSAEFTSIASDQCFVGLSLSIRKTGDNSRINDCQNKIHVSSWLFEKLHFNEEIRKPDF